ncbi:MAG: aminoacyl-tRNA hydrolase [Treponema sp.]|jgi:PTH1 family peptidyl-tRNA hydrolase|nr:aminoacyl-tRNA hydrolase [Treponema sp.]
MIDLVAFLGNPGVEYALNRHNAGRLLAEKSTRLSCIPWQKKFKGLYTGLDVEGFGGYASGTAGGVSKKVHFLKPETFMNLSGNAVSSAAFFFKLPVENILIVHDELDLALGEVSLKFSGGLNGHNGLRSMRSAFNSVDFWRLRIGIGRPADGDVYKWVLSDFTADESPALDAALAVAEDALTRALVEGAEKLLPEWKKKKAYASF